MLEVRRGEESFPETVASLSAESARTLGSLCPLHQDRVLPRQARSSRVSAAPARAAARVPPSAGPGSARGGSATFLRNWQTPLHLSIAVKIGLPCCCRGLPVCRLPPGCRRPGQENANGHHLQARAWDSGAGQGSPAVHQPRKATVILLVVQRNATPVERKTLRKPGETRAF